MEHIEILANSLDFTGLITLPADQVFRDETFLLSEKQYIY